MLANYLVNQRGAEKTKMKRLKAEGIETKVCVTTVDSISRSVLICLKDNNDAQELEVSGGEGSDDEAMPPVGKSKAEAKVSNEST